MRPSCAQLLPLALAVSGLSVALGCSDDSTSHDGGGGSGGTSVSTGGSSPTGGAQPGGGAASSGAVGPGGSAAGGGAAQGGDNAGGTARGGASQGGGVAGDSGAAGDGGTAPGGAAGDGGAAPGGGAAGDGGDATGGAAGDGGAGGSAGAPDGERQRCGRTLCGIGQICCEASCGACGPIGDECPIYDPCPPDCTPMDARAEGNDGAFWGYAWNGTDCVGLSGSSCEGEDCDVTFDDIEECRALHDTCLQ